MALFAVIGDSFICKILKQVSHDYDLDYEEMKSRYCGESSFEKSVPSKKKTKKLVIDLEVAREPEAPEVEAPEVEAPEVEAPEPEPVTKKGGGRGSSKVVLKALSKMKKPELVQECERRDLDSEGTVAQLKERVKDAREAEGTAPVPKPAKKTKEVSPPKEVAPAKKKAPVSPPKEVAPVPVLLEEEEDVEWEDASPPKESAFEEEDIEEDLEARLRKILADAEDEDEDEDGNEDDN